MTTSLKPLMRIWPNSSGMVPGLSSTKIVQTVPVGCISRSQGQKIGFQNSIFKNLVWNHKAQTFHIWYRNQLEVLYQSCSNYVPGIKMDPTPGVTILHWGSLLLAPLWHLNFSSGERPRALWTLLFLSLIILRGLFTRYMSFVQAFGNVHYKLSLWQHFIFSNNGYFILMLHSAHWNVDFEGMNSAF